MKNLWQPFDTAPETGTFLVFLPVERVGRQLQVMNARPNISIIGNMFAFDMSTPTHWHPLPDVPAVNEIEMKPPTVLIDCSAGSPCSPAQTRRNASGDAYG